MFLDSLRNKSLKVFLFLFNFKILQDSYYKNKFQTFSFFSFDSMAVLNVNPCSFETVGKKNGANLGTLGGSLGLFRCLKKRNNRIQNLSPFN